jgi:hypothetical protein
VSDIHFPSASFLYCYKLYWPSHNSSSPFRFFFSSASPSFNSCLFHVQLFFRQSWSPTQWLGYTPDVRGTFVRFLAHGPTGSCTTRGRWGSFFWGKTDGAWNLLLILIVRSHRVHAGNHILPSNGQRVRLRLPYSGTTSVTTQSRNMCNDIHIQACVASFNQTCLPGFVHKKWLIVLSAYCVGCECCTT